MTRRTAAALAFLAVLVALAHLWLPSLRAVAAVDPEAARTILFELRLPRTALALGYGAVLGLTGAAMQAVFANPLVSSDLTGVSGGASVAAIVTGYWLGWASPIVMALAGAGGAILALLLLLAMAGPRPSLPLLLLSGLAINLAFGALSTLLLALAPSPFAFYDSLDWLMGNLADHSLYEAAAALGPAALACGWLLRQRRALDLLVLGEDSAAALGLAPRRLARRIILVSGIAVGACVAVVGAIGFVGLIAPVVARRLTRGLPGQALPAAAAIGALLLGVADLAVRAAPLGRPLPVGVLTALVGVPLFLVVLLGQRGRLAR